MKPDRGFYLGQPHFTDFTAPNYTCTSPWPLMSSSDQKNPDQEGSGHQGGSGHQKWAETDEWEPYRQIITDLYITEKKTVQEVTALMEQAYGFKAT